MLPDARHEDLEISIHGLVQGTEENLRDDGEQAREFWLMVAITSLEFIEMIDAGNVEDVYGDLTLEVEHLWAKEWAAQRTPALKQAGIKRMRESLKAIATEAITQM